MAISKKAKTLLDNRLKFMDNQIDIFMEDIPSIQNKVFRDLVNRIKDLDTDKNGKIKSTTSNLRKAQSFRTLRNIIVTEKYTKDSNSFVNSFDAVKSKTDSYFKEL